jgi:hypothetical protein
MAYGDKRNYRKIDIFLKDKSKKGMNKYLGSTTWAATCKQAKERYAHSYKMNPDDLIVRFSDK